MGFETALFKLGQHESVSCYRALQKEQGLLGELFPWENLEQLKGQSLSLSKEINTLLHPKASFLSGVKGACLFSPVYVPPAGFGTQMSKFEGQPPSQIPPAKDYSCCIFKAHFWTEINGYERWERSSQMVAEISLCVCGFHSRA